MELKPLSREELKDLLAALAGAEKGFAHAPHCEAVEGIRHLKEASDIVCEVLPGGLFTFCETCEMPIGCEEESASGDDGVTICGDCLKRYEQAA